MLPHLRERPLTMKRFPDGVDGKSFFEKHIPSHAPDWVPSVDVSASDGQDVIPYAMVNDLPTLAWAANLGTIELHVPALARRPAPQAPGAPDHMVFDLDPGEGTSIVECCVVAGYVTDELPSRESSRSPRRAGPRVCSSTRAVGPRTTWDSLRERTHEIARKLESDHRGTGGLQHAEVAAPGTRPHRLEPEPPGQDDRRRLLGPGDAGADGLDTREPRRGAAVRRQEATRGILRFETDDVLRRVEKDGDLFAPLGLLVRFVLTASSLISRFFVEIHMHRESCGGLQSLALRMRASSRHDDRGWRRSNTA